jgi:penicillin-binding protein 1C
VLKARAILRSKRVRVALAAAVVALVVGFWAMLPARLFDVPLAYVVEDRNGALLGARLAADGQWRFPPTAAVPEKFAQALVVFEDKRFWQHPGVDPLAMARALRLNARHSRVVSGGSTLTMQVARLARGASERTYSAKLLEILWALRIEAGYSKREILALYANNAPFGGNVVGIEAAAWRYFGRDPDSLSWAEAATLAVLPNSPALVHVARNRDRLLTKRNALLARLHASGAIDAMQFDLALAEPLTAEPRELPRLAPHLLDSLRAAHPDQHRFTTTINADLQVAASAMVGEHSTALARQEIHNAAAIVVDNRTFEVVAYVGNSAWSATGERGYAVDIVRRPRSTGSLLKPLLYAAMLEEGSLLPQMLLPDVPTQYAGYSPENFDRQYRGAVPADVALAQSLNVPAVRMLRRYGVERFYALLKDYGMTTLTRPANDYGLTLVLGGAEGTLWDMAQLQASLTELARRPETEIARSPRALTALMPDSDVGDAGSMHVANTTSATNTSPSARAPSRHQSIGPGAAWLTLNALLEVTRPGEEGHWRNFASANKIAWKTGTSWGMRDAWAVGSTSRYTVAVWVGNATGEGRPGLIGSTVAAPLLFALFNRLGGAEWFAPPYYAMKQVDTCRNDGYLANDYCAATRTWVPRASHFDQQTPHNLLVHLDATQIARVDSSCESPANMRQIAWFVLPPTQGFYYRREHAAYRELPQMREDCAAGLGAGSARPPLDFVYPAQEARIYVPLELDGRASRVVFEAAHRRRDAEIHWHLDGDYLGATRGVHQQALDIEAGEHTLTIVDGDGQRVTRRIEILPRRTQTATVAVPAAHSTSRVTAAALGRSASPF